MTTKAWSPAVSLHDDTLARSHRKGSKVERGLFNTQVLPMLKSRIMVLPEGNAASSGSQVTRYYVLEGLLLLIPGKNLG